MLATVVHVALVLAVLATVGAPTVGRARPGGASIGECVVAGVLTLARLQNRRNGTS